MHNIKAKPGIVVINGKQIPVDSQNEAHMIAWLERAGFTDRWRRIVSGAVVGGSHYTGDFELAVQHAGKTRRAILEVKPYKKALTANILRRMRGVASYYNTDLLLMYANQTKSWHRIDVVTGVMEDCQPPTPGDKPLSKLPKIISLTAKKHAGRYYGRKFNPLQWLADLVIGIMQGPKPRR